MKTKIQTKMQPNSRLLIYIATFLFAACSPAEVLDTPQGTDGQEINFTVGLPPTFTDAPGTRAAIEDIDDDGDDKGKGKIKWEERDVLHVKMTYNSNEERTGTIQYTGSAWTITGGNLRWPVGVNTATFSAWFGNTSEDVDCAPAYIGSATDVEAGDDVAFVFTSAVNQFIFRGLKTGQTLTLDGGWTEAKLNATKDGFEFETITGPFTGTGDDMVLYLVAPNSGATYSIDGGTTWLTLSGVDGEGERFVVYCNGGGTSTAAEIAERERFINWDGESDFTLKCDIDLMEVAYTGRNLASGKTFDGGGHTIRGLVATYGLFGTNNGTIKNVIVQGAVVTSINAGAIAANNSNTGIIVGCQAIDCTVTGTNGGGSGGIVGHNLGKVIACYTGGGTLKGSFAGGTIGFMGTGTVIACYAAPTLVEGIYSGPVVGDGGPVTECYYTYSGTTMNTIGTSATLADCYGDMNAAIPDEWQSMVSWSANGLVYL